MILTGVDVILQISLSVIMVIYFMAQLKSQHGAKSAVNDRRNAEELLKLKCARLKKLTQPLSEKARPETLEDIVGQEEGIKALRAAICSANPQHVIIYGPPGVGKTCAARVLLGEAKASSATPFCADAPFVEVDATCVRFDERAIADPLFGSVQGAGALGQCGVPQPKPGAVTRANGGVLFLDEIGELHPVQMNKLLKVLEDRRVMLDSAYYDRDDPNTPGYIKEIFERGLPADFRLIGATTRQPHELPQAVRSRCLEIYFRPLKPAEMQRIAITAAKKSGFELAADAARLAAEHSASGRDAVNIVQLACGAAQNEGRRNITPEDIAWVTSVCRYPPRREKRVPLARRVGTANGLAVLPDGTGTLIEVEATCVPGETSVSVTGIVDEEELANGSSTLRRRSTASASVENVLTALKAIGLRLDGMTLHINFPGGIPVDGPSAGCAVAIAVYSAVTGLAADNLLAATGEVSIRGDIKPVGGVRAKLEAALSAGALRAVIPEENAAEASDVRGISVTAVGRLTEALAIAFSGVQGAQRSAGVLSASPE